MHRNFKLYYTALSVIIALFTFNIAKAQSKGDPPAPMPGLEITRTELLSQMSKADSGMVFRKVKDTLGRECYRGRDGINIRTQLIGSEHDLKIAKISVQFVQNEDLVERQLVNFARIFVTLAGQESVQWLRDKLIEISDAHGTESITGSKLFNFMRDGKLDYNPTNKTLTLTFTSVDFEGH